MKVDDNAATMRWRVATHNVDGKDNAFVELSNGYNTVRIPAEEIRQMDSALSKLERTLDKDKRYYGPTL